VKRTAVPRASEGVSKLALGAAARAGDASLFLAPGLEARGTGRGFTEARVAAGSWTSREGCVEGTARCGIMEIIGAGRGY
jgi:hypothetical protein